MYKLILRRTFLKRSADDKIKEQINHIIQRGLGSTRGRNWSADKSRINWSTTSDGNLCETRLTFQRTKGRSDDAEAKQWDEICQMLAKAGSATRFPNPWRIWEERSDGIFPLGHSEPFESSAYRQAIGAVLTSAKEMAGDEAPPIPKKTEDDSVLPDVQVVQSQIRREIRWEDLNIPDEFLGPNSDETLRTSSIWENIYGVNAQIRLLLSNIRRAKQTHGESRLHAVVHGPPGCGKSTVMAAIEEMLGSDAVLKLDATSTTRAGLEKLFFQSLPFVPPIVIMEEIEKANEEALALWLGALDDRGEIRKVNFRVNQVRRVRVLFLCTVNNKTRFDQMLANALSSRCCTQIHFPRPARDTLRLILAKEIRQHGGNMAWVEPALDLANSLGVTDPRIVKSYLAGGDRLLDKSYHEDWLSAQGAKNQ